MLKIAYSSTYSHHLPEGHRFPMEKYDILHSQLLYEGTAELNNFFIPELLAENIITTIHTSDYWYQLKNLLLSPAEVRASGFPHSYELIERERIIAQGTLNCTLFALQYGVSANIAGGTHHSFTNRGEGFCLLNDLAMAAQYLLDHKKYSKILILDLDVHQGNGTAEIFKNEKRVFTMSMHGEKNYPLRKENSDLDIGLADGTTDEEYLKKLAYHLPTIIDIFEPQIIFYQAGVDILITDKLGRLAVTHEGCKKRDEFVLKLAKKNKIPIVVTMGGGYSPKISDIIEAHANTFRAIQNIYF
ncbi:MAG: histone deacetylase [Bacteroidetes bacterium]|nr:MAG: histone deacetylase [Bacteroidota bacterium]